MLSRKEIWVFIAIVSTFMVRATLDNSVTTLDELYDLFDCGSFYNTERPINSDEEWSHAIDQYRAVVGEDTSIESCGNGFNVSYEVQQFDGKGRGVVALEDIKMGQIVYQMKNTAVFGDGESYRQFLFRLDKGFACDVFVHWAYVYEEEDGEVYIGVDLDPGSYMNDADHPLEVKERNVDCSTGMGHATRDISAGEELICSYSDFHEDYGWEEFGLGDTWE